MGSTEKKNEKGLLSVFVQTAATQELVSTSGTSRGVICLKGWCRYPLGRMLETEEEKERTGGGSKVIMLQRFTKDRNKG
jgi:hypothetical protein